MKVNVREVLRKQLIHSARTLSSVEDHDHMSDDCGDYVTAALDVASAMWEAYEQGDNPERLGELLEKWSARGPDENWEDIALFAEFADGGVSEELASTCAAILNAREEGDPVEYVAEGYFPEEVDENVRWTMREE